MTFLSQIRPINLREQVVQEIRTAIIEGRIKPNDHITEAVLTEQLGVSRTPVREALILLEREGLVVAAPNRGCFVKAFTVRDVSEIFTMRTMLENFAGELIIQDLDETDFQYLRVSIAQQKLAIESNDFKKVRSIDMAFHQYLVTKSNHDLLIRNWSAIVAQIAAVLYLRAEAIHDYDESQSIKDHMSIVDAYEKRDVGELKRLNHLINSRVSGECQRSVSN
ncbi:MAG: GntR family transcriptional regulator [Anaerolineaceae bacterium]|nr:GntR family transcriptional regulator [Anaerolineaceae bacterium]